jgi:IS1 family transposase
MEDCGTGPEFGACSLSIMSTLSPRGFVELQVSDQIIWHGYDEQNEEILQHVTGQPTTSKIVALSRIQSVSETYVLVSMGFGRFAYWKYHDGYEQLRKHLQDSGLL